MEKEENLNQLNDDLIVQRDFDALIQDYLNTNHRRKVDIITRAFEFAKEAHKGVRRRSGEPYILHPIAVAHIVCKEIGLGSTSICAALLHDVVEDTSVSLDKIKSTPNVSVNIETLIRAPTEPIKSMYQNKQS